VGRFLVQFHEACGFRVRLVSDGLAFVKLKEGCGIELAKLALCRPEFPFEGDCGRLWRKNGWTVAEELVLSVELSVYLDADFETDCAIIYGRL